MRSALVPLGTRRPQILKEPIRLAVLGSTGSIGKSVLHLARQHPNRLQVVALAARSSAALLIEQAREFRPQYVACAESGAAALVEESLRDGFRVGGGLDDVSALAELPEVDVVVAAIVGSQGLLPVLRGLRAGKRIALANKESLVAGGALVREALGASRGEIIPVDSEHSALFQALLGVNADDVESLMLTASGGPFLFRELNTLRDVTPEEAVKHPRWNMGAKISVDSATLMNKGLELIEAARLFDLPEDRIETVVHRQSIVHSLIRLTDGSLIAQLSNPDMCGPIGYALTYPSQRLKGAVAHLNFAATPELSFQPLDEGRFPAVRMARVTLRHDGAAPAVLNAANEVAVQRFLERSLRFDQIMALNEEALQNFGNTHFRSFDELVNLELETKEWAKRYVFT